MDDRHRLKRAQLVERVRTVEKGRAARASAEAEAISTRLTDVAEKTRLLVSHFAATRHLETADDLRRHAAMRHQLHSLSNLNASHLQDARRRADAAMVELGSAERKRARVESDRRALERFADARSSTELS